MIKIDTTLTGEEIAQSVINRAKEDQISFGTSYVFVPDDKKEKPRNVSIKEIYDLK